MKKLLFGAALLCAALFSSCGDEYDDTALRNEMEGLKDRIAALEEKLTQEVNTLKGLIAAAEKGLAVGVEETTEGYEVTIGDETFTINHGKDGENGTDGTDGADGTVITVVEVDGVYYWAINGEATEYPVTGNDGEDGEDGEDGAPGQNGYTPEIKDGKWYINGEEVGPAVGENGKDGDSFFKNVTVNEDDTVTFTLANDTTITVALAKSAKYADVQSIKFVPEYEDGKITVGFANGAEGAFVKAKYEVIPAAAAELIAKYADDASMQAVYTKTRTEAGDVVELPVSAIEAKDGFITVTASAEALAEEFFAGSLGVSIRFAVQDDLSGNASEYVAAVAEEAFIVTAAIDEGTDYIRELFRQWGTDWYNYGWYGQKSINGLFESVKLTWNDYKDADKVVVAYEDKTVEVTDGSTEVVIEGLKTSPVEFTVTAYAGENEVGSYTVASDVYTLPETASGTFSAVFDVDNQDWTIIGEDFNTTQYATWNCSFNIYEKGSETPVFENPITKNGNNATRDYISYICRGDGWVQTSKNTHAAFHVGDGNWDQGKKFKGLKGNTEYEVRFELNVWPYIYNAEGPDTDGVKQWDMVKALLTTDKATNHGAMKLEGTTTFTTGDAPEPVALNVVASIDNGTVYTKELFRQYGTDWYNYAWNGLRSVNGQLETVELTWNEIPEADRVVVEYLDQTMEPIPGLTFCVVNDLKTSPVEFTVTAYKGDAVLVSETVSSPVYLLPETASGTFNATYSAEKGGWTITGVDFNTTQYATWNCSFNLYEKGSETPVFENPITKNGNNGTFTYISHVCRGNGLVQVSKPGKDAFHVGEGEWDQGKVFKGLKGDTEYEVRFELNVWPYIYDPNGSENADGQWDLVKIMMSEDKATMHGAMKLEGTTTFTTGAGPAPFEAIAAAEGYQGAKVTWIAADGATGYEVYVGETKVADATADATEVVVTGLTDARKYTFNVKALGTDLTAQTPEVDIYTLFDYAPEFDIVKQDDGSWKFNMYKLAYAGGIFRSIAFTLKEKGSDEVLYSENGTPGETGFIADGSHWGWTGARATNWVQQTDSAWSTAEGKKLAGIEFKYNTTYVIEYTATLNPGIAAWTAAEYTGSWTYNAENMQAGKNFFFKSMLVKSQAENANIPLATTTGTMEFTTEAAPAPAFDLAGNYTKAYFDIDVDAKNGNSWTDGVFNGGPTSFTSVEATTDGGPAWMTKYNKYGLTLHFDIDSAEIADMPGCYALVNLKDRNMSNGDKIVDHGSHYNSTTGEIVFKIVIESSSAPGGHNGGTLEEAGVTVPGWAIGVTMTPAN